MAKSGDGAHAVYAFDKEGDKLQIEYGNEVNAREFADNLLDPSHEGFICQEKLVPHPDVRKIVGDTIASVRIIILYYKDI